MRFRVGLVFCLFAITVVLGCREPLRPNVDANKPPETWITAAPFDTITLMPPIPPLPGIIPVRFHVYWAGSDVDGAVVGFYWAVTETLPRPEPGFPFPPSLPGPKPQDYRYTAKTDSIFVFTVAEDIPDRNHAFFIYAVDDKGRPDPTPARFIFNAQHRLQPIPMILEARAVGTIYQLQPGGGVAARLDTVFITDVDRLVQAPRDTVAASSSLSFRWTAQVRVPGISLLGYRYKLDEGTFVEVGPEVDRVVYNSGLPGDDVPPAPGTKLFVLRAVDQAFGTTDSTRRFQMNHSPDTWFSGPDINSPSLQTNARGEKFALLSGGSLAAPITGTLFSPDSVITMPTLRPERRTFFEIWRDTVFVRQEGDTVHLNSWIVVHNGGFDRDSEYGVKVTDLARTLPEFPPGDPPVLRPGPANGSPVGFRSVITQSNTLDYLTATRYGQTGVYPLFDPNDVQGKPVIGGYHPMLKSGITYALARAEDGDGELDGRILDARNFIEGREPHDPSLRPKVLVFHANQAPILRTDNPLFRPRAFPPDTFVSRSWDFTIIAHDWDAVDNFIGVGGPSNGTTLRRKFVIRGIDAVSGDSLRFEEPVAYLNQQDMTILVPENLQAGRVLVDIELCDCLNCELTPGEGRCIVRTIEVQYLPPAPTGRSRPGLD